MRTTHIEQYQGRHVHFIGIGGISMSGLAEILLGKGYQISGSDLQHSAIIDRLEEKGARIFSGHFPENVQGADLIVHTAAVKDDNPEMVEAARLNIPILDRATLLGQIMGTYPYAVGVSGTHGKTTTTSMLSIIMNHARLDPTILVGGELDAIGGNVRAGNSNYFITEACEYVESFLKFHPYLAIILNIDSDHLDYFKDIDHIYHSFANFAALVPPQGFLIGCGDDPLVAKLAMEVDCHTVLYGIDNEVGWQAQDITYDEQGCASFRAVYNHQNMGWLTLKIPGRHNIQNAMAAVAAAWSLGISMEVIREGLLLYQGTHRRFEVKGTTSTGVTIIDDYAHHPTEVKATLEAAANYPHNRMWCVFQPHTYTRTRLLLEEFSVAFDGADHLIIADIYAAREKNIGDIHSRNLADAIREKGQSCLYLPSFEEIADYVLKHAAPGDIVLTMGAGNVYEVGEKLLERSNA